MELTDFLRVLNTIAALLAIPPAVGLLHLFLREAKIPNINVGVNRTLRFLFATIVLTLVANAFLSLFFLFNFDMDVDNDLLDTVFNIRNLIVNLSALFISWSFWLIARDGSKGI